jgi:HPt (histidine-containing phosphotransfer) domain-containing protein
MEKNMVIEIPEIDAASGLELCDGDMGIYLNSLRLYVSSIPASLEKMSGVSNETLKDYSIAVHGVKSMSEYIGAEEARKTAKQLEALAKGGDLAGVLAQNETFIKYAQNIVASVRSWLEKNDPSGA